MLYQTITLKKLYFLIAIFICCFLVQLPFLTTHVSNQDIEAKNSVLTEINQTLIENAILPILLSEDNELGAQQLTNLIQNTAIYQVQVFDNKKRLLNQSLNLNLEIERAELIQETINIEFQNELAGIAILDVQPKLTEFSYFNWLFAVFGKSLLITLSAFLIIQAVKLQSKIYKARSAPQKNESILEPLSNKELSSSEKSLLLYIYVKPDNKLLNNPQALSKAFMSFGQKLEDHLHIYGGRILSLSKDKIVCRMPTTGGRISLLNYQQAITFCWGISNSLTFNFSGQKYQLNITSLLHKISFIARTGSLTRAIYSLEPNLENQLIQNGHSAYLTNQLLEDQYFSGFSHEASSIHSEIHQITDIKDSLKELWEKQTEMIGKDAL